MALNLTRGAIIRHKLLIFGFKKIKHFPLSMRKYIVTLLLALSFFNLLVESTEAVTKQVVKPTVISTVSPTIVFTPTVVVKVSENITEPGSVETVYRLETVLENSRSGKWNGFNTFKKGVETAIDRGVAANTIVLLLLLPLIATLVSVLHYIFGLSGYGIFMPTMMAVAFLATGIVGGMVLFGMILTVTLFSNYVLRRFKLHFWPARSINLMFITLGTFGVMMVSTYWKLVDISQISIFPILFMIMLTEEFVRTQLAKSKSEAKKLMIGTLILAVVGAVTMQVRQVQELVLLHPGISLMLGLVVNLIVGNYSGIRWSEISRFRRAIRVKK